MDLAVSITTDGAGCSARRVLTVGEGESAWPFSVWEEDGDGEPRIRDLDAAVKLGFSRPRDVRKIIERIWPESPRPIQRPTVERTSMPRGGERVVTTRSYWLTEAELLKLIARSETPIAESILDEMIRVYMAVRRHLANAVPVRAHERKPPAHRQLPAPKPEPESDALITIRLSLGLSDAARRVAKLLGTTPEAAVLRVLDQWGQEVVGQLQNGRLVDPDGTRRPLMVWVDAGTWETLAAMPRKFMTRGEPDTALVAKQAGLALQSLRILHTIFGADR